MGEFRIFFNVPTLHWSVGNCLGIPVTGGWMGLLGRTGDTRVSCYQRERVKVANKQSYRIPFGMPLTYRIQRVFHVQLPFDLSCPFPSPTLSGRAPLQHDFISSDWTGKSFPAARHMAQSVIDLTSIWNWRTFSFREFPQDVNCEIINRYPRPAV